MKKIVLKSIGAVAAGLIAVIILSNGTDILLESSGIFPPVEEQLKHGFTTTWMLLLFMVIGGYITAWLSPNRPMRHALILGLIGMVLGILGAIAAWGVAPPWFLIMITVLGLPAVWLGGKLKTMKKHNPLTTR